MHGIILLYTELPFMHLHTELPPRTQLCTEPVFLQLREELLFIIIQPCTEVAAKSRANAHVALQQLLLIMQMCAVGPCSCARSCC